MKMRLIAAAVCVATFGIVGSAAAADVSVYGRVDTGLLYKHADGEDSLEMAHQGRSHNRVGLNIVEDLGNGWKAKGYLENGFYLDEGAMDDSATLFNRRSILAIAGPYGELGMGRAGTVQSTVAPYTMGLIKYDPFGTSYGNASIGTVFANTSRVNNSVHYISPKFNGFNFGASYTMGDSSDEGEWQDNDHTFTLAGNYTGENLYVSMTYANVSYNDTVKTDKDKGTTTLARSDANLYGIGGWWRFAPEFRLFAGLQYQQNWKSGASVSAADLYAANSDPAKINDVTNGGFNGVSALLGMDWVSGAHKVMAGAQYFDGELDKASDVDLQRLVLAGAYEYYFRKNVIGYFAVTYSTADGKATERSMYNRTVAGKTETGSSISETFDTTEIYIGLNYNF